MAWKFSGALFSAKLIERGVRLEELAVVLGKTYPHLSRVRQGRVQPSARLVEQLAEALGCDPGEFYADDGTSRAIPPGDGQPPPPLSAEAKQRLAELLDLRGGAA
jgi:transcriptional regulator with XRE-family HTH domain